MNLAIQLISDSARHAVQQSYANSSVSDEYYQSQRASRGEGHITQTTVDQQWESHLINDAEFTANTQLPSVTFDVNDSYVSQQLGQRVGEEVSHFYHPTPPPARNPTGFWRGVDNVLKMRQGTINAISSRFTGNYEAPQDPWKKAGYVLGEAIENRFTGGRVIGNVQKLERLGFFGHNGAESSVKVIENTTKSLAANPFKGKTFEEIDKILTSRGYKKIGPDPANGKGSYFHPETGRKYYLDNGGVYKEGVELPHVDVHRMKDGLNLEKVGKRRYPIGDTLIEENVNTRGYNANF